MQDSRNSQRKQATNHSPFLQLNPASASAQRPFANANTSRAFISQVSSAKFKILKTNQRYAEKEKRYKVRQDCAELWFLSRVNEALKRERKRAAAGGGRQVLRL